MNGSNGQPLSRRAALVTAAMIGGTRYAKAQEGEEGLAKTSSTVAEALKIYDVPGSQLCLVDSAKPVWNIAAGVADKSSGRAMTAATRFEAASLSKPVFACAILLLCEQGRLSLNPNLGSCFQPRTFLKISDS